VVDAVTPVPVLAAGGIVDGRGLAAVLTLGAAGAWMGTRFLLSEEAAIHPDYQAHLSDAVETDTAYSELFDVDWPNAPLRTLRNSTHNAWEAAGCPVSGQRPGEGEIIGANELGDPVPRYSSSSPTFGATGNIEAMALYSGQGVGLVNRRQTAGEIVREVANEAARVLDRTRGRLRSDVTVETGH
jgi:nitronate monooxygenase